MERKENNILENEAKEKINSAFERLKALGVPFQQKDRVNIYSINREGCFIYGKYMGQHKIIRENEEYFLEIFEVIEGIVLDKDVGMKEIKNEKIGLFTSGQLNNRLHYVFDENGNKEEIDRKGHIVSIIYTGQKEIKEGKKKYKIHTYNFKDITLMSK
jgi:hypothetical protein